MAGLSTTQGQLAIKGVVSLRQFDIQFVPPELIINRTTNTSQVAIVSQNVPEPHWAGGTREIPLKLDLHSDTDDNSDIMEATRYLESLTYHDGISDPPEKVMLIWGNMFKHTDLWQIKDVKVRYSQFYSNQGYLPRQAEVDLLLLYSPDKPVRRRDILWR